MRKTLRQVLSVTILSVGILGANFAQAAPSEKTFSGKVVGVIGNAVVFNVSSGAVYTAQSAGAKLMRKYGADMKFEEIFAGDKIEVRGMLDDNNNISSFTIRNLSLYAHTGTFNGKIGSVNSNKLSFTIQNKPTEIHNIYTDSLVVIKKNGKAITFADLKQGMNVAVRGVWDRSKANVTAKEVLATERMVNVVFSGRLVMKGPDSLTVMASNNAMYAIDITNINMQSKNGKNLTMAELNMDDTIKIVGKHVSGSIKVTPSLVRDMSITK